MFYYSETLVFEVWEGSDSDFFPSFFLSASFEHSSMTFVDFVGSQGLLRDPNGSHFGSLRGQIWV